MSLLRRLPQLDEMWDIVLYVHDIVPPCRTVLMVVKELELELTIQEVNLNKQEHLSEEFLKINPLHTIPVLEEQGYILTDSHAIACFLIDDFSMDINPLYPKQLSTRALINQYLMFEAETMFPPVKRLVLPIILGQESSISEEKIDACREMFSFLNKVLQNKEWLVGDSYTVADISCVTTASSITVLMDMDLYPNVKAWIKRCEEEIPSYKDCNVPGLKKLHALLRSVLPSAGLPSTALPNAELPSAALPNAELPSAAPPSAAPPSAAPPSTAPPSDAPPSAAPPSAAPPSSAPPSSALSSS